VVGAGYFNPPPSKTPTFDRERVTETALTGTDWDRGRAGFPAGQPCWGAYLPHERAQSEQFPVPVTVCSFRNPKFLLLLPFAEFFDRDPNSASLPIAIKGAEC
jgi:hypothetical protein